MIFGKKTEKVLQKELDNLKKNYSRNKKLKDNNIISELDFENGENDYLQYSRKLDDLNIQLINNSFKIEQLKSQIIDVTFSRKENIYAKY